MTILRDCPTHGYNLCASGGRLICPHTKYESLRYDRDLMDAHDSGGDVDEVEWPNTCQYTETLPEDVRLKAAGAPMLPLEFGE